MFIAWTTAQWVFSYNWRYKRIHFSMCSKSHPSYICSSTFPNYVNQIVKIGYPHIFYKDKRPHGGHDCAGKQGQQTLTFSCLYEMWCDILFIYQTITICSIFLFQLIHFNQISYLTCDLFILLSHEEVGCPQRWRLPFESPSTAPQEELQQESKGRVSAPSGTITRLHPEFRDGGKRMCGRKDQVMKPEWEKVWQDSRTKKGWDRRDLTYVLSGFDNRYSI